MSGTEKSISVVSVFPKSMSDEDSLSDCKSRS